MRIASIAKKSMSGKKHQVRVLYKGKMLTFEQVTKRENLTREQVYGWWKRHGRPANITPGNLSGIHHLAQATEGLYTLLPDGTRHTGRELCEMFGLSHSAVSNRRIRSGQYEFIRDDLEKMAKKAEKARAGRESSSRPRSIHDVEYHP